MGGGGGLKVKKIPEIQPELVCELLIEWHLQRHIFCPPPLGIGEGP